MKNLVLGKKHLGILVLKLKRKGKGVAEVKLS